MREQNGCTTFVPGADYDPVCGCCGDEFDRGQLSGLSTYEQIRRAGKPLCAPCAASLCPQLLEATQERMHEFPHRYWACGEDETDTDGERAAELEKVIRWWETLQPSGRA